ncbi:MAG: UDP-N-acetylglucosamine 2-epimerase (non-hydrolyzing) [Chloroflexi bacterium]|nr:UDP-N-acetylglucosamine 2-epimerase (non-hydrolyzing) [Chloroflexota bacterium]MBV9895026.1 UDP-N-acetylglucosamine 2-epimerase (non-hydrolyzing) [Chloroflexota bacterium]
MRIASIVGARPQFIKAAPLSRVLRQSHYEMLIHTGQHYDYKMSQSFFDELEIPEPDINLGVGSGAHGVQTAEMLRGIEEVLIANPFDVVLVYGDTNSTLAGALAAAKLHIPVAHVEAGLRSYNRRMPEEVNRVLADHISTFLFCPTDRARANLASEGIVEGVHVVGDVMLDALRERMRIGLDASSFLSCHGLQAGHYILATIHRAENTDDPHRLAAIVRALAALPEPVLLPLHPRTRVKLARLDIKLESENVCIVEPLGFSAMLTAEQQARAIVTDSGGVQKEASWLGVPCVTVRDETEWVETVESGWNVLVEADVEALVRTVRAANRPDAPRGSGLGPEEASSRIRVVLEESLK